MDNSFLLQTKSYCLSCLRKNETEIKSIQSAINYLNVDVKKLFSRTLGVSTEIMQEVDVQGTLCENCGERLDKFVKIKEEMERLKVELDSCLRSIHDGMERSEDGGVLKEFKRQMINSLGTSVFLEFVKQLRLEMMNGCLEAVGDSSPAQNVVATGANGTIETVSTISSQKRSKRKRRNVKTAPPKKKFACNLCPRRFSHRLLLFRHRKRLHPELHLKCDMCPAIYYFTETMNRHKLTVHPKNEASNFISSHPVKPKSSKCKRIKKVHKCEFCGKCFKHNAVLKEHRNGIHLNHFCFKCNNCGKSYKWRVSLYLHSKRCGKPSQSKLNKESYKNVQFGIQRDYDVRPRTHRPNYNFDIDLEQLDKNETSSASLSSKRPRLIVKLKINRDSKSPHVSKPFKCGHCPKSYTTRLAKLDHERVVHKGILFKCNGCEKQFRHRNSLWIHRNKFHGNSAKDTSYDGMPKLIKCEPEFQ